MTTAAEQKAGEIVKADPAVVKIEQMIGQNKAQMAALLGKHISVERLFQIALTTISRVPKLKDCTTASVLGCVMESSRLRLPAGVGAGGTWLIPRENKKTGQLECTLIIDYRAIILMMKRDAGVETVVAEAVHAKDAFDYGISASGPYLEWKPAKGERGAILGYVSASWNKAGKLTGVIYKTVAEIKEQNAKKSMAAQKGEGPWATDPEWMYKKSVLRPLGKLNPGIENDDLSRAIALDERADIDLPQNLHLLADATAKPQLENEGKTYTAPKDGEKSFHEKLGNVAAKLAKKGLEALAFTAWVQALPDQSEEAVLTAVAAAFKRVTDGKEDVAKVFAVAASTQEKTITFKVSGVADSEWEGEPAWCIRDDHEPVVKRFTNNEDVYKAAKAAQKSGDDLSVKAIEKASGKNVFDWINKLA
jgi:recombination protein RecT